MSSLDNLNKLYKNNISLLTTLDIENLLQIKSSRTLEDLIKRLIQENVLTSVERGKYYITSKQPSNFEIANFLYSPSYISFETALNYYGLLSQFPLEITSATLGKKAEKEMNNQLFTYSHIDKKFFTGYYKESNYLIATKEKALFDEIYLISKSIKSENILENLDLSNFEMVKFKEFLNLLPKNTLKAFQNIMEKYL
jgi:predicted transcriptional regulator of viral defense system